MSDTYSSILNRTTAQWPWNKTNSTAGFKVEVYPNQPLNSIPANSHISNMYYTMEVTNGDKNASQVYYCLYNDSETYIPLSINGSAQNPTTVTMQLPASCYP